MTYHIRHNEKPKEADFYILHDVGAIQENDSQQGPAHFLEHMAFNGTKNLPGKQLTEYLEPWREIRRQPQRRHELGFRRATT